MAEIAAGAIVAEEVVSTTVQAGALGAAALAQPTQPLKCMLKRFAVAPEEATPESLTRSSHSLTVIDRHAYIWGGLVGFDQLAGNELHIFKLEGASASSPDYQCIPAITRHNDPTPAPRAGHVACSIDGNLVIHGGYVDIDSRKPLDEGERLWIYKPSSRIWSYTDAATSRVPPRADHAAVAHGNKMIIHGGRSQSSKQLTDTWMFDFGKRTWTEIGFLKKPTGTTTPPNMAIADGKLYLITGSTELSGSVHILDLAAKREWKTLEFPTNPLTPGPQPRVGAGLLPIKSGMGRTYLLFMLGENAALDQTNTESDEPELWSKLWALQLPSPSNTPAQLKDATRENLGASSHEAEWSEVSIIPRDETQALHGGKAHPGPRAYFGFDSLSDTKVLLWGGVNPRGETEGDGWIIEIESPQPSSMFPAAMWPSYWFGTRQT